MCLLFFLVTQLFFSLLLQWFMHMLKTFYNFVVPDYVVGQSEAEASKEGRTLADFYYGCLGYSVYMTDKDSSAIKQHTKTQLPVCVGLEVCRS